MNLLKLLRLWPPFSIASNDQPDIPGIELAVRKQRLHFRARNDQPKFRVTKQRLHFRATER